MKLSVATLAIALMALPAHTEGISAQVLDLVSKELRAWSTDPALVAAVIAANEAHAPLTQAQIDSLDTAWKAEVDSASRPTIDPVLSSPVSQALKAKVEASGGKVVEAFVTDNRGLNVAQSGVTSDFWQGDEAKFLETFPKGADAVHVSDPEFDESTQSYQVQASFAVTDPATGAPIGSMTLGLDAETIQ